MGFITTLPRKDRYQDLVTGQGMIAESFNRMSASASQTTTVTQELRGAAVGLRAGDVVTNINFLVAVAGTSYTIGRVGLYKKDGTLLASCANDTTIFTATAGMRTVALSAAYTVPTDDLYYPCYLGVFTGTAAQLMRGTSLSNALAGIGSGAGGGVAQTGQADLPSPSASFTVSGTAIWIAVS